MYSAIKKCGLWQYVFMYQAKIPLTQIIIAIGVEMTQ